MIPSISAEVQDPEKRCSALQHDSSHYRIACGQCLARPVFCRALSHHAQHYSRVFLNRTHHPSFPITRKVRWNRLDSAVHSESRSAFSSHSLLRYDYHLNPQAASSKHNQVAFFSPSSLSPSSQQNIPTNARSRTKVYAKTNRSELTGIAEETTRVIRKHTICHKIMERTTTNESDRVENAYLTNRNNGANAKVRLMPKVADIAAYFKEYCDAAGVHGVRYLTEDRRNLCEKIFWFLTLIFCAVGCALMIAKVKSKLDSTPVVVTFAESETNVWHLPFPAVTVCPHMNIPPSVFNFTSFAEKFQDKDDFFDDYISYLGKIESKIGVSDRLYYQFNDSIAWVQENFTERLYNYTYGDDITEELAAVLDQMLRNNVSLSSREVILDICNSTSFLQDVSPLEDNELCKSIRKYYPVWVNETKLKMLALSPFCPVSGSWWYEVFGNSTYILDEIAPKFLPKVVPYEVPESSYNFKQLPKYDAWKRTWTRAGRCYTFNMISHGQMYSENIRTAETFANDSETSNDWHPDKGYSDEAGPDTYPRRSVFGSLTSGFHIRIFEETGDRDLNCDFGNAGYMVMLHHPQDHPAALLNDYIDVSYNQRANILIKPIVIITSPVVEKYDAPRRQCYLSHEKHLKYFKYYTQQNCLMECLTNATLRKCGCVANYMPRNESTKMCGWRSYMCMDSAEGRKDSQTQNLRKQLKIFFLSPAEMELHDMSKHLKDISLDKDHGTFDSHMTSTKCDCLPSCLSITYEADTSTSDLNALKVRKMVTRHKWDDYYDRLSFTYIHVSYKKKTFIAIRRNELYGEIDFLANCGGLLGLFCGFSLISFIEFVYFLTIRLWSNVIQNCTTSNKISQNSSRA